MTVCVTVWVCMPVIAHHTSVLHYDCLVCYFRKFQLPVVHQSSSNSLEMIASVLFMLAVGRLYGYTGLQPEEFPCSNREK